MDSPSQAVYWSPVTKVRPVVSTNRELLVEVGFIPLIQQFAEISVVPSMLMAI